MDLLLAATPPAAPAVPSISSESSSGRSSGLVELVLVAWHWLFTAIGLPAAAGITWVLAIVGLVLVVRSALIPLFVKQIKSQRKMMEIAPELRKVQEKYKGKKDQLSREAMSRETMALYKKHGTKPVSELPAAARADADLLRAVQRAQRRADDQARPDIGGVGLLNTELTDRVLQREALRCRVSARHPRRRLGSPGCRLAGHGRHPARARRPDDRVAVLHAAADHLEEPLPRGQDRPGVPDAEDHALRAAASRSSSRVSSSRSASSSTGSRATCGPWCQQFLVIRNMPTPGSEAAKAREERLARKGKAIDSSGKIVPMEKYQAEQQRLFEEAERATAAAPKRQQPVGKQRAKKQAQKPGDGGSKPAVRRPADRRRRRGILTPSPFRPRSILRNT